ncbi:hypothetical protein B0T10DRAFT_463531 [Thelonectria olida]|uniref:Uncharacterized protein n=1 Tax=Thelonectria olida TaxID=1576542 RepID=A0A9P9ALF8_9HYPO|nr:hypothetical protein B0T10DRAFT_463531 [Thelonectria olida]
MVGLSAGPEGDSRTVAFDIPCGSAGLRKKVANERDLEYVQHSIVEGPVSNILHVMRDNDVARRHFDLGNGIVFDNHPNSLSDSAEEPTQRRNANSQSQLRADQVCVYKHDDMDPAWRSLAFVIEYKPPHKPTLPHLRLGLREMDIQAEVVNRATVPADDPAALFQYHSDKIVAAAVAQTYHCMITGGLEYSYLTTGEAYVFFKIDWANATQLLFHLAEPRVEVEAHVENSTHCTAVSQVLAFTLLAMKSRPRRQSERHKAIERLNTWTEDYEAILRRMPATQRKQTPPPSAFEPRAYKDVDRSPYISLRGRIHRKLDDPNPSGFASYGYHRNPDS